MNSSDQLTDQDDEYCLAKPGQVYAILRRPGCEVTLDLGDSSSAFKVGWFNPRSGGQLQEGSAKTVRGPGKKPLGFPPTDTDKDWIILVR